MLMDAQESHVATMETKEDDSDEDYVPGKDDGSTTEEEENEPEKFDKDVADQIEPKENNEVQIENDLATMGEGSDGGGQFVKEEGNVKEETLQEDALIDTQDDHKTHNHSKPQGGKGRKRKTAVKKEPKKARAPKVVSLGKPKGKHSSLEERQLVIDMMLAGKCIHTKQI